MSIEAGIPARELKNGCDSRAQIEKLVREQCQNLEMDPSIDKFAFLMAICGCETDFGMENVPRFEYEYSKSGLFYRKSKLLQGAYKRWGDLSAQSYGPWQIMYINAVQLGMSLEDSPKELTAAAKSLPYVIKLLNSFNAYSPKSKEDYAASYNAGAGCLAKPNLWPKVYVKKFVSFYEKLTEKPIT